MKTASFIRCIVAFPAFMTALCVAVTCLVAPMSVRTAEGAARKAALSMYESDPRGILVTVPGTSSPGDGTTVMVSGLSNASNTANFTFVTPPAGSAADSIAVGDSTNSANVDKFGIDINALNRRTGGVTNISDSSFYFDFELDVDVPFGFSGFFHSTSASPAHGSFEVSLVDVTDGTTVFDLPGSGNLADFLRTLSVPNGILSANTEYLFSTDAHIDNSAGDVDQAASSEFSLAFDPAPVPEPASLCLLAVGTLALLRRRR